MESLRRIQQIRQKAFALAMKYENIMISVSGGSDSDIITHIIIDALKAHDKLKCATFVFFDTGLEFLASKKHLKKIEDKYNIKINIRKPKVSAASAILKKGQPFISKHASEMIKRLQKHEFEWEDEELDVLLEKYQDCKSALKWWTNGHGENSNFNIEKIKYLKEFMVLHPPEFKISNDCCKHAKKNVALEMLKECDIDLNVTGVRKAEGGARATAYKTCFEENDNIDTYKPVLNLSNKDKEVYKEYYEIEYSDCYSVYGLKRTGCVGCPYGSGFEKELKIAEEFEPNTAKAVKVLFKDSYEYTRRFRKFKKPFEREVEKGVQLDMWNYFEEDDFND